MKSLCLTPELCKILWTLNTINHQQIIYYEFYFSQYHLMSIFCCSFLRGQQVQFEMPIYINDFSTEFRKPQFKLKTNASDESGILIENVAGTAHTWIPYFDGAIYLTSDGLGSKNGNIILRTHDGTNYVDYFKIDGATGKVSINELEFGNSLPEQRQLYVDRDGVLTTDALGICSISALDFVVDNSVAVIHRLPHFVFPASAPNTLPMFAPVHLPDGAAVTGLRALVYDHRSDADMTIQLVRLPHGSLSWQSPDILAGRTSAGTGPLVGYQNLSDITIQNQIVDNNNYSYYIVATPTANWDGSYNLAVNSVRVNYRH